MNFPTLVFRCPGAHYAHDGQTYEYAPAEDDTQLAAFVADGWSLSLVEAVDKANGVSGEEESEQEEPAKTLARNELEMMASKLGIKFDGRTTDAALLRKIEAAEGE